MLDAREATPIPFFEPAPPAHSADPLPVLSYARSGSDLTRWRPLRVIFALLGVTTLVGVAMVGVETGFRRHSCRQCGAVRVVESAGFYGVTWQTRESVSQGPISQFLQSKSGRPCPHAWEYAYGGSSTVLRIECGKGYGNARLCAIEDLERIPTLPQILKKRSDEDSAFVDDLESARRHESEPASKQFLEALQAELWEALGR